MFRGVLSTHTIPSQMFQTITNSGRIAPFVCIRSVVDVTVRFPPINPSPVSQRVDPASRLWHHPAMTWCIGRDRAIPPEPVCMGRAGR
ncbi:hypothetical protein OH492_04450 [Vibrio chagasii]|nr:hypothetical protein [Vibrio chagasii]